MSNKKKIAVVGAGFTGLTAAYELTKKGYDVTIFEATGNLGGLASGFSLKDGTPLERAYHFLYTTDNYIIDMANELGVGDTLHFNKSSIKAFYGGKWYPFVTPIDLLTFGPLTIVDRLRTGWTGLRLLLLKKWQPLTKITAYEWLCQHNGKHATDLIWKPLLKGKFDIYWDKVTMAWLWTRIHVRQTSRQPGESIERLGYFDGGFQTVVKRWEAVLRERGVQINLNTRIESINRDGDQPTITIDGQTTAYDSIIMAMPNEPFVKLTAFHPQSTPEYRKQLTDIDYLDAALMVFTTTKPFTDTYWHQIHDENAPYLVLLSLDALVGTEVLNGHHIYYIGDYTTHDNEIMSMSEDALRDRWIKGTKQLFADFDENDIQESYIFRFRNAQHIVDTTYEDRIPAIKTPLDHIYLANFSQIFPEDRGTNYAVREGKKVAEMVHTDLSATNS